MSQKSDLTPQQIKVAQMMSQAAQTAQQQYLQAFIAQTGLKPDEVSMIYGVKEVLGRQQFEVKFVRRSEREELVYLRSIKEALAEGDVEKAKVLSESMDTAFGK